MGIIKKHQSLSLFHILHALLFMTLINSQFQSPNVQKSKKVLENQSSNKIDYIGDKNYTHIVKQRLKADGGQNSNHLIAILFTNKNCKSCFSYQPQIVELVKKFIKQKIQIFRCQLSQSLALANNFEVKRFPIVHFVHKVIDHRHHNGKDIDVQIYKTNHILGDNIIQIAKFLNKILQYQLRQDNSVGLFQTLQDLPILDRIIVNFQRFYQRYSVNMQELIQNVILNQNFNNMPIILLTQEQFQMYMIKYGLKQQTIKDKVQRTIIFIAIQQDQQNLSQSSHYIHTPISTPLLTKFDKQNFQLIQLFQSFLLYSVQQFTQTFYKIQQQHAYNQKIDQNIYLVILDSIWRRKQSLQHIKMLNRKVVHSFQNEIVLFWTEGEINLEKKVLLGFQKNDEPPLFGKLALKKNQVKSPLVNVKTSKPIFNQIDIKKKIRNDLGYQHNLIKKINIKLQENSLEGQVQIKNDLQTAQKSNQITLVYCTSKNMQINQINELIYTSNRFKGFYPHSKLSILTTPCIINRKQNQDGFYLVYENEVTLVSKSVKQCIQTQQKILSITNKIAYKLKRRKIIPNNFCILEKQMKQYLLTKRTILKY